LGNEAAAEVARTKEIVKSPEIEAWLNRIGGQLAKTPQANAYPFYFKLVNDESINAFALPGGPMFVHSGLIRAADSEGEVAGVLAHEMSHVALRHGAAQLSKQQTWGTLFGAIGAAAGAVLGGGTDGKQCSLWCQAVQMGAGLGGNSVLLKFSRGYERDADLNGARMMAAAGYDPMELVNFFEKLEKQLGRAGEPKGLALWMSDHPATGNRVEYITEDIQFYPRRNYNAETGQFANVKRIATALPPPKPMPGAMLQAKEGAQPRGGLPAGLKDLQAVGFAIGYPTTWQAGQAQAGGSLYLVPQDGIVKSANGGVELIAGAMLDYYRPEPEGASLEAATGAFLDSLAKGDPSLKAGRPERAEIGGKPAMLARLATRTSKDEDQAITLYTVMREAGLWYLVLAAPTARLGEFEATFRQIADTVLFPN